MPEVNGKKYPYTAAGKAAAKKAAMGMAAKPKPKTTKKATPKPKSKMTPEDKAYSDLLKKYGNDVTKIPGFKNGKGTK